MKIVKTLFNICIEVVLLALSIYLLSIYIGASTNAAGVLASTIFILPLLLGTICCGGIMAIISVIGSILRRNMGLIALHSVVIIGYISGLIVVLVH